MNKKINAFDVFKDALKQNISISPGQIFSTDASFSNYIRISFGIPYSDSLENSLKILGDIVKKRI